MTLMIKAINELPFKILVVGTLLSAPILAWSIYRLSILLNDRDQHLSPFDTEDNIDSCIHSCYERCVKCHISTIAPDLYKGIALFALVMLVFVTALHLSKMDWGFTLL